MSDQNVENYISYIKTLFPKNSRIAVAMSGGVDSSFAATIIKRAGFEVIGITLELYKTTNCSTTTKTCCSGVDIEDAKQVALKEGFLHYVLDYSSFFKNKVIDNFVDTYEAGATPIPCVRCNQYIKFGKLLDFCKTINVDFLVTGHYIEKKNNAFYRSKDEKKDQSYFLALTTLKQFDMLRFPLASIEKVHVKAMAANFGLSVANKRESQDICFVPNGNYKKFLFNLRPEMFIAGEIKTVNGSILGFHSGLVGYTIGQRKNLNLSNGPWYVLRLNVENNELIVGRFDELLEQQFELNEVNLLVETKYFQIPINVQIRAHTNTMLAYYNVERKIVQLKHPQASITPGQICAFYDQNRLLGGGVIKKIINKID